MLDIGNLNFKVSTVELEQAARKILELGAAIQALEATQRTAAQVQKDTSKLERQAIKDAAALAALKLKLAEAEAKAAAAANGTNNANRQQLSDADKLTKLLERLNSTYLNMADGLSRGESNILQMARSLGATDIQLQQVRASLQQIAGLSSSPFDSSLGSLRAIQKEMDALNDRSRLAAQGIFLTTKQLQEYSRLGNEIRGQMAAQNIDHTQGAGASEFTRRLAEEQAKYLGIANSVNTVTAAEKARNDVLNTQKNILAGIDQENKKIASDIARNSGITSGMQAGASQNRASTTYDNTTRLAGAGTPEQAAKIREQIDLTNKLKESERLLNIEIEKQNELVRHIEGIVAQRKAMDDLNKSIIANVAERTTMDALTKKYTDLRFNSGFAKELATAEFKGASQASIDSLKTYALGVQAAEKATKDAATASQALDSVNKQMARDAAASRYLTAGHSSAISNKAAALEIKGVPQSVIDSFIQNATAKERDAKAARELTAANQFIIDTEHRLAAAMSDSNQNLNRRSTDELVKYQRALTTAGVSADVAAEKMALLKHQLDQVAGKERANQLNHLSRAISTQMGDVGVSLASGMNPLTIMMQQGDQIRFAIQNAGAEGKELEVAMAGAARQIGTSIKTTSIALAQFVTGSFKSIGVGMIAPWTAYKKKVEEVNNIHMLLRAGFIDATRHARLLEQATLTARASWGSYAMLLKGGVVVALAALAVGFFQVMKEEEALATQLTLSGGSMGLSYRAALDYAVGMNEVGITTSRATEVIAAMAKEGGFLAKEIPMITKAAVDMQLYAGIAVDETVKSFAKLRQDPVKAMIELATTTGMIAPEVVRAVIELKEQGKTAEAVALSMQTLANVNTVQVARIKEDFTGFAIFMKGIGRSISDVFSGMLKGLWVKAPVNETLRETREALLSQVADMEKNQKTNSFFGINADMSKLTDLRAKVANVTRAIRNNELKTSNEKDETTSKSMGAKLVGEAHELELKYSKQSHRIDLDRLAIKEKIAKAESLGQKDTAANLRKTLSAVDERYNDAIKSENKKDKGKGPAKASFSGVHSDVSLENNTSNIQREYSSAFSKAEKLGKFQRDILKLNFDADLISRGEYVGKDIKLIVEAEQKKLQVIAEYGNQELVEYEKVSKAIAARKADALNATKDAGSRQKINLKASDEMKKLTEAHEAFQEIQNDRTEVTKFEALKRYNESLKEQNRTVTEATKGIDDLDKSMKEAAIARQADADFMWNSIHLSGAEAEAYKAKTKALQQYSKAMLELEGAVSLGEKYVDDLKKNLGSDPESLRVLGMAQESLEATKLRLSLARIDAVKNAEKEAIDAYGRYYLDKAVEVRDGTASAITEGIMNGGKAGSEAIKGVLDNILKDLLNNAFKKILGSVGDMILESVLKSTMMQKTAESGGGFFESIVKMGLGALGGSFGGSSAGAGLVNPIADTGGFGDAFGLAGRAVGGFVNKGSEYMVGENGPEKFIPKQAGSIVPNHKVQGASKEASNDPMKVTIINNTSAPIGKVTERQISATDRALIIEEAVMATAAQFGDPNSRTSKSLNNNYRLQRNR